MQATERWISEKKKKEKMHYTLLHIFFERARSFLTTVHNFVPALYILSLALPE